MLGVHTCVPQSLVCVPCIKYNLLSDASVKASLLLIKVRKNDLIDFNFEEVIKFNNIRFVHMLSFE